MNLRQWFRQSERPAAHELKQLIGHYPCSDYRNPAVMRAFLAGFKCGFKLTDEHARPTDALRALVEEMGGARLLTGDELRPEEQRAYIGKKVPVEVAREKWFIHCGDRIKGNAMATWRAGWAWDMLPGLTCKRLTERDEYGGKSRTARWIVVLQPNWRLNDLVYYGLLVWAGERPRSRDWGPVLAGCLAAGQGPATGLDRGVSTEAGSAPEPQLSQAVGGA